MRRAPISRYGVALGLLVLAFTAALGLYVREELRGGPWRPAVLLASAPSADGFPTVVRTSYASAPGASSLRVGDRILRAGGVSLRGAASWTAYARMHAGAGASGAIRLGVERGGARRQVEEALSPVPHLRREVALALLFVVTALLVLWRAPRSPLARSLALAVLAWGLLQVKFPGAHPAQTYAFFGARALSGCLWAPLVLLCAIRCPEGVWPEERPLPRWPWLFAALGLTWTGIQFSVPIPAELGVRANPALSSAALVLVLAVLTRNYGRASAQGRRQVKWVLLGCYVGFGATIVGSVLAAARPELSALWFASQLALVAIPLSIFVALTRSNLFDVDRLISSTASFTLLLVGLGTAALTILPWMAEQASARAGVDPAVVHVGLAVLLALSAVRLEPVLRPQVDRIFFRERHALQAGIDRLVADLSGARDVPSLASLLGERLDRLLRPELLAIWARADDVFAPIFVRRCAITPHFEAESALLARLGERVSAVELERAGSLLEGSSPADRAALEGLGAAVFLPVVRDGELVAFAALGRKVSGDVYTATDLALLGLVGSSVSAAIRRFGDEEILRDARALQERLRQYVPASIADRLASGSGLEAGERTVSVLFADLRGYSSLAEGRVAEEIFRIVSAYTETVTRVVSEHGGTVVEFNGDGMMAVFGAPDPLPDKERRALSAARRIVTEVSALRSLTRGSDAGEIVVGVGVATGAAYVGAIRSADRYIWSALGNTTNLAARLQTIARDFGSPIVIDDQTRRAASEHAADFERRAAVEIRGLRTPRDVFVLGSPDGAGASA